MSNNDIEKQLTDSNDHLESLSHTDSHQNVDAHSFHKILTSDDGTYVYLGNQKFLRNELVQAFGGLMNPGLAAPSTHKFGNPAPLGLSAFALTTFVLSLVNAGAMGVSNSNIVVGLAFFYGGFIQLLAGMWEMALENTFGALAFGSYGGFWMAFSSIFIPWFNIAGSYTNEEELENAVGFFLLGFTIFTFMLCLTTCKSTVAFFSLFFFLDITFLLLTIAKLGKSANCGTAGGVFGIITAFIAWYNAYAGLATPQNTYLTVRGIQLPKFGKEL